MANKDKKVIIKEVIEPTDILEKKIDEKLVEDNIDKKSEIIEEVEKKSNVNEELQTEEKILNQEDALEEDVKEELVEKVEEKELVEEADEKIEDELVNEDTFEEELDVCEDAKILRYGKVKVVLVAPNYIVIELKNKDRVVEQGRFDLKRGDYIEI